MINLLPPEIKKSYRFAMRNVSLLHWLTAALFALAGVGLIGTYGWVSMHHAIADNKKQANNLAIILQHAQLNQTNKQVADISNSLKLSKQVLSQEILFSKLLKQMATALPTGTKLTGLNIPAVTSGSALDVTAEATSYAAAAQVQVNLADPSNKLFTRADIQSITCDPSAASDPNYPCQTILRAEFSKDNPFLFMNQTGTKS